MSELMPNSMKNPSAIHVVVLFGGRSAEREVSLKSGAGVAEALRASGLKVTELDFDQQGLEQLLQLKPDVVFNVLHGSGGEDGEVQGILEYLNIPYTGSGIKASAITMDKLLTKKILSADGIPTPDFLQIKSHEDLALIGAKINYPVMVKPVYEGSSIGMSFVQDANDIEAAYQQASQYGEVMAEAWIKGKEYTVAFLDGEVLPIIELQTDHVFYDFNAKYESNDTRYICPCDMSDELREQIHHLVMDTIQSCEVTGWGRVDIMCDESGTPYVIEVNTTPGMTEHSLVPMAAKQAGLSYQQLTLKVLQITLRDSGVAY